MAETSVAWPRGGEASASDPLRRARARTRRVAVAAAIAIALAAAVALLWHGARAPSGPLLDAIRAKGELVVSVRAYARPAPPGQPSPPEPDAFDVAAARFLADRLQVSLRIVTGQQGSTADLDLAGARAVRDNSVATPYTGGTGALVVLRGSAYTSSRDLARREVCVPQGSPYVSTLSQRTNAVPRIYPSAIRAVAGFMAGECQALADDEVVIARLLSLPEWRFYRRLGDKLPADDTHPEVTMRLEDRASAAWLDRAVRDWRNDGALTHARDRRAGDIAFEVTQLQDGLVCHS
ncbi:transporter substrate-binding domain-containing protein [Cupriavidus plantarum]|uniref:transporter substrate-binding domain-containing protein n=1 Tax=Cupriavidus plantarum TaxID=942865 RepID=UPI001B1FF99D|nr:transporter substrate-binding domain-containing protein [Cupriavidus plantarum]CAG2149104.1 hypothetical protein LMG26296_04481 [Cupriavidus plantarum]SMR85196.1 amino acid ABC transporter substrate-binding protein, PAAT family [Cupriavidus plantarum]